VKFKVGLWRLIEMHLILKIDKRLKGDDFITCVLHELVHVKQQFKGELKEINGKAKRWKDEIHIGITSDSKISADKC
jgi:predicted metallopeptidase